MITRPSTAPRRVFRVCPPGQIEMPQAERTYGRFWFGLTPHGSNALALSNVDGGPATCP
jgi:hypothetical protein